MNAHTPVPELPVAPEDFEVFDDGIYFGLDADEYHADPALGSSDMKKLANCPEDYWWDSAFNPYAEKEKKDTPAQILGSALHLFVLEGRDLFEANYAPTDLVGSTKAAVAEREAIKAAGKTPLKRQDYERVLASGQMIRANPVLAPAVEGGEPEVSVFWTRDGIRRKARIDYLKPLANVDLKSIANVNGLPFVTACRQAVSRYRYDIQAEHYLEARQAMCQLVADGAVDGDHDPEWLKTCAVAQTFAHVLVFWQKEGSPLTWGTTLSAGNPILEVARMSILRAEENWRRFVSRFGFEIPWIEPQPLQELDMSELPGWHAL